MTKVVINTCYGGFGLSLKCVKHMVGNGCEEASKMLERHHQEGEEDRFFNQEYEGWRHNPLLVQAVEELGREAFADASELEVKEIESSKYIVKEYDGWEEVIEPDDIDWISKWW